MNIRPFQPLDVAVAAVTFMATFNAAPWSESWTEETASACLRDLLALPRSLALIAWDGQMCLGAVLGQDQQKDRGLTHEVRELFIHPQAQGQGVGKALMNVYLQELDARGVQSVFLLTARESDAEQFYTRLGFRDARRMMVMVRP